MRRSSLLFMALVLLSMGIAPVAMAHEGEGGETLQVEPSAITAGDSVVLAGSGLEPDSDRVIVLVGSDLTVAFGTARTDADGMFSTELVVPDHLPMGNYEFQAIGDETLTVPLGVTAAVGSAGQSPSTDAASETVVPRQREPLELAVILGLVVVAAGVGGWLVWRAERFRGAPTT